MQGPAFLSPVIHCLNPVDLMPVVVVSCAVKPYSGITITYQDAPFTCQWVACVCTGQCLHANTTEHLSCRCTEDMF